MDATDPVLAALDALAHPYEMVPCDPALADTAQFCEAYGYSLEQSANAIVVVGKSEPRVYAVCLVLAATRLDVNGAVRRRFGVKKASFASADETVGTYRDDDRRRDAVRCRWLDTDLDRQSSGIV
jgi:prolyl-tRNA editing enzyme YbaK/EbsC (Cys-tRNA(Pro) deacylase)